MGTKRLLLLLLSLLTGCSPYRIPIETECHPACPQAVTPEIPLSPILEIDSANLPPKYNRGMER